MRIYVNWGKTVQSGTYDIRNFTTDQISFHLRHFRPSDVDAANYDVVKTTGDGNHADVSSFARRQVDVDAVPILWPIDCLQKSLDLNEIFIDLYDVGDGKSFLLFADRLQQVAARPVTVAVLGQC